jgi:hypothetical protein
VQLTLNGIGAQRDVAYADGGPIQYLAGFDTPENATAGFVIPQLIC